MPRALLRAAALTGAALLPLALAVTPAQASTPRGETACFDPASVGAAGRAAPGARGHGPDTTTMSPSDQRAVEKAARAKLAAKGRPVSGATVPVYVHVMLDKAGNGDVTQRQIDQQIAVLNTTFGGGESSAAADTGFSFTLAGVDRFYNDAWHQDRSSSSYRKATRQGGSNALNIWLVDFKYLGIATFPWEYAKNPGVDGIRVQYSSLPGGDIANYNLGETATHEAGHWFGLYHTFQGGCTETNDEVADTPAQAGPSTGCPVGADTCPLPGVDPIHNYMDYSYDSCYDQFTPDQADRMRQMFTAYRT